MSQVENMLSQLIQDAEITNPNSEAVIFFKKIMKTTNIDVSSKMTDSRCNANNTAFENFDNPEYIFEALESVDAINIGEAIELGMSEDADIDNELTATLSIEFTKVENFDFKDDFKHTMVFKRRNFTFLPETSVWGLKLAHAEKTPVLKVLFDVFDKEVLEQSLRVLNVVPNEGGYVDEIVVSIDFEGKEYVVKELIRKAMLDERLNIEESMLP